MVSALNTIFPYEGDVQHFLRPYQQDFRFDGAGFGRLAIDFKMTYQKEDGSEVTHTLKYAPLYHDGKICTDDSRMIVYTKIFLSTFVRPYQCLVVMCVRIAELFQTIVKIEPVDIKEWHLEPNRVKAFKLVGYFFMTPFVEIAIIVTGVASLFFVPLLTVCDSGFVFRVRDLLGRMEVFLLKGEYHGIGTFTRCFQAKPVQHWLSRYFFRLNENKELVVRSIRGLDYEIVGDEYMRNHASLFNGPTFADDIVEQFKEMTVEEKGKFQNFIVERALLNYAYSEIQVSPRNSANAPFGYVSPCLYEVNV